METFVWMQRKWIDQWLDEKVQQGQVYIQPKSCITQMPKMISMTEDELWKHLFKMAEEDQIIIKALFLCWHSEEDSVMLREYPSTKVNGSVVVNLENAIGDVVTCSGCNKTHTIDTKKLTMYVSPTKAYQDWFNYLHTARVQFIPTNNASIHLN